MLMLVDNDILLLLFSGAVDPTSVYLLFPRRTKLATHVFKACLYTSSSSGSWSIFRAGRGWWLVYRKRSVLVSGRRAALSGSSLYICSQHFKTSASKSFSKISSNVIVNSHLLTSDMITKQVEAKHCKAQAQSIAGGGESHQVDYHGRYSKNARLESSIWSTFPHKWLLWSEVWARQGLSFLQVIQDKQLPCPDWRRAMMPLTHGDGLHKEHNLPFTRVLSSITRSNKLASLKVTQVRNYDPVTKSASHRGWSGGLLVTSVAKNGVCGCAPTCANMFFELLHKTI